MNYNIIDVSNIKLNLKSDITYVDSSCKLMNNNFQFYETILGADNKLLTKATKAELDVSLSILQAGIDRKIGSNDVYTKSDID